MATSTLEIVSASVNLTKSLLDFSTTTGLVAAGKAVYDWLLLEKVDRSLFIDFCVKAKKLAYPNEKGLSIQNEVEAAERSLMQRIKDLPIQMIASGSLGRFIGRDPELAYLVTTVAVLVECDSVDHAANTLCMMLTDNGGHENGISERRWHYTHTVLASITRKVVESIWLNICNIRDAADQLRLPQSFKCFEGRSKILQAQTFAAVARTIQSSKGDVIIRSEVLFADLALWLYFHFNGTMKIVENSKVSISETCGRVPRTILWLLNPPSKEGSKDRSGGQKQTIEVSSISDSIWKTSLRDSSSPIDHGRPSSRKPFHELDDAMRSCLGSCLSSESESKPWEISYNACLILDWILALPVGFEPETRLLTFFLDISCPEDDMEGRYTLEEFFACSPKLLQQKTRRDPNRSSILSSQQKGDRSDASSRSDAGPELDATAEKRTLENLCDWFPKVSAMMKEIRKCCYCFGCRTGKILDACKRGCLRIEAITRLLLHLAHGISDAMGAKDASGGGDILQQRDDMAKLLHDIVESQVIQWDRVFALVASIISGVRRSEIFPRVVDESSSWVAIQNGSFVALARWLDLSKERSLKEVFALDVIHGARIAGVAGEVALLRSEGVTTDQNHVVAPEEGHATMDAEMTLAEVLKFDNASYTSQKAVFFVSGSCYRLLTLVGAGDFIRNVDMTLALLGYLHSAQPKCSHRLEVGEVPEPGDKRLVVEDFDHAVETWGFATPSGVTQFTKTLNEPFKVNAILSASPEGCVVREVDRCCLRCALTCLEEENHFPISHAEGNCSRVVNICTRPTRSQKRKLQITES